LARKDGPRSETLELRHYNLLLMFLNIKSTK